MVELGAATGQFFLGSIASRIDAAGNVDLDQVAIPHQTDRAAFGRLGRDVADGEPEVPPEKRPSVTRAQAFPSPFDFR
jgi:hypothetical protein